MGRATPSPPRAVTAYPAAMFLAAFTSALQAKPQAVHTKRAWLSRDSGSTCPHTEHRWLVNAGLIFSTRPGALSSSRRTSSPQPDRRISRLSPDLARTFLPGLPAVPLAERVMFLIWRSSTLIRSNRRATAVLVFSDPVLAPVLPTGLQPSDGKPHLLATVGALLGACESAFQPPQPLSFSPVQAGGVQQLTRRQGRGYGDPPVNADHRGRAGCRDHLGNSGERDMPAPYAIAGHPIRLFVGRCRAGPAEPYPTGLRNPDFTGFPARAGVHDQA